MKTSFLDLARGAAVLRDELDRAFHRVLESGHFVLGEQVEAFEEAFAAYCGAIDCVGVASGSDAIALALRAGGVRPGDEVVTAAFTALPTVAAIVSIGARPVLADVEPQALTLDPDRLLSAIGSRTRAVVAVHLYGQCADMEPIASIANERGLLLLEDAAQAHGAEYLGRRAGTLGDLAAFSFYPTKNLGALGDSGAVVTNDPGLSARVRLLRAQGERSPDGAAMQATHSRLDELQAAMLLVKLRYLDGWIERRRAVAGLYVQQLDGVSLPIEADRRRHAYHLFAIRIAARDQLRSSLAGEGIETQVHYPRAVHQHPAYSGLAAYGSLPHAEAAAAQVLSLPLYPELTDSEVARVAEGVRRHLL